MKWPEVILGDVCNKIGSGATPKGGSAVYIEDGTSFIRSQNVYNLRFDYDGLVYITEEAAQKLNGVTIEEQDVLINITGDSVARTCVVPSSVLPARVNQHVAIIRPKPNVLDPRFLNYYLASPYMQAFMLGLAVGKGASRNAMTKDMIAGFKIPCPPIYIQEAIVNKASAYDDLIENNKKQIALLEEAAQRLYKEWFVDLRFPGYEDVQIVDGVPEGWYKTTIENKCTLQKTIIHPEETQAGTAYIGLEHIPRHDFCLSDWGDASEVISNKYVYKQKDIIFGQIRPYFHKVGFAINDGVASTDSFIMTADDNCWGVFLLTVSSDAFVQFAYQTCKEGAKMPRADWRQMKEYPLLIPDASVLYRFETVVANITGKIRAIVLQNHHLMEARDRLLPKLMSGEIKL